MQEICYRTDQRERSIRPSTWSLTTERRELKIKGIGVGDNKQKYSKLSRCINNDKNLYIS